MASKLFHNNTRLFFYIFQMNYRVAQQCCPGGNCPETPLRPPPGGSPDFLAKSLANPDKIFKKMQKKKFLKILSGFASDFSQNIRRPPRGGSPGGLRTISAGTTLLVHTVERYDKPKVNL